MRPAPDRAGNIELDAHTETKTPLQCGPPPIGRETVVPRLGNGDRAPALMRPALIERETDRRIFGNSYDSCFNEARPDTSGKRAVPSEVVEGANLASMRPALIGRETWKAVARYASSARGFNEARPDRTGNRKHRDSSASEPICGFNEARPDRTGNHRDRIDDHGLLIPALMRPALIGRETHLFRGLLSTKRTAL